MEDYSEPMCHLMNAVDPLTASLAEGDVETAEKLAETVHRNIIKVRMWIAEQKEKGRG